MSMAVYFKDQIGIPVTQLCKKAYHVLKMRLTLLLNISNLIVKSLIAKLYRNIIETKYNYASTFWITFFEKRYLVLNLPNTLNC